MSINSVTISGNLTRDPELRQTQGGMAILSLGVAVNDRRKNNQTGQWEDHPNFIDCSMIGDRAQKLSQYLSKGTKVAIKGKLSQRSWQAQDGSKRSKVEVLVDDIEFMSARQQAPQAAPAPAPQWSAQQAYANAPAAPQAAPAPAPQAVPRPDLNDLYDENIPF